MAELRYTRGVQHLLLCSFDVAHNGGVLTVAEHVDQLGQPAPSANLQTPSHSVS
jgi:hypothetical protein